MWRTAPHFAEKTCLLFNALAQAAPRQAQAAFRPAPEPAESAHAALSTRRAFGRRSTSRGERMSTRKDLHRNSRAYDVLFSRTEQTPVIRNLLRSSGAHLRISQILGQNCGKKDFFRGEQKSGIGRGQIVNQLTHVNLDQFRGRACRAEACSGGYGSRLQVACAGLFAEHFIHGGWARYYRGLPRIVPSTTLPSSEMMVLTVLRADPRGVGYRGCRAASRPLEVDYPAQNASR